MASLNLVLRLEMSALLYHTAGRRLTKKMMLNLTVDTVSCPSPRRFPISRPYVGTTASYQTLSALLSSNVSVSNTDCESSDDCSNSSSRNKDKDTGLSEHGPPSGFFLKQELVESPKEENPGSGDKGKAAVAIHWGESLDTSVGFKREVSAFPPAEVGALSEAITAASPLIAGGTAASTDVKGRPGALLAALNAAASAAAAAAERRGFIGDAQKRDRFNEFITGFLSMSLFQAADVWLPLAGNEGAASGKTSRLFLFSSNVQDPKLAKWSTLSRNVVLASGVGLPGLVFQERRPQWAVRVP